MNPNNYFEITFSDFDKNSIFIDTAKPKPKNYQHIFYKKQGQKEKEFKIKLNKTSIPEIELV